MRFSPAKGQKKQGYYSGDDCVEVFHRFWEAETSNSVLFKGVYS